MGFDAEDEYCKFCSMVLASRERDANAQLSSLDEIFLVRTLWLGKLENMLLIPLTPQAWLGRRHRRYGILDYDGLLIHILIMLCKGGVGAYIFAKRQINADRHAKLEEQRIRKQAIQSMEYSDNVPSRPLSSATMGGGNGNGNGGPARTDSAGSPSQEASADPAPTRHAPATESQRVKEKSKYESTSAYRSPKEIDSRRTGRNAWRHEHKVFAFFRQGWR